jgi:hypothetical protein
MRAAQIVLAVMAVSLLGAGAFLCSWLAEAHWLRSEARRLMRHANRRLALIDNPEIPAEVRKALDQLAAEVSHVAPATVAFRGVLLADELRKTFALPDIVLSVILYKALTGGVDVEGLADLEHADRFGVLVGMISSAAAELSSCERELTL